MTHVPFNNLLRWITHAAAGATCNFPGIWKDHARAYLHGRQRTLFLGGKKSKAKQSNAVVTCSRLLPTSAQINLECCGKHSVAYPLHGLLALVCLLAASTQDSKVTADFRLVYNLHTLCLLWEA